MRELETEIRGWRRAMRAELPPRTVRELEEHLWEHIAALKREGIPAGTAFARAAERLGDPHALGREFASLEAPWLPASWSVRSVYIFVGALIALSVLWSALRVLAGVDKILFAAHYLAIGCGYFVVFGMGLVAINALVTGWRRPLASWKRQELRKTLFRMIGISAGLMLAGALLGLVWGWQTERALWTGASVDLGAMLVGSTSLILLATRSVSRWSGRVLPWLATLVVFVLQFVWYGTDARTAAVPIFWLVLALFFTQTALMRLNYRRTAEL